MSHTVVSSLLWDSGCTLWGFSTPGSCPDIQLFFPQVCLVGKSRNYQSCEEADAERRRAHYIQSRQASPGVRGQRSDFRNDEDLSHENGARTCSGSWGVGFQPRDRVESVRNCANLPRDFVDSVVLRVANVLLGMTAKDNGGCSTDWNQGGNKATQHQPQIITDE